MDKQQYIWEILREFIPRILNIFKELEENPYIRNRCNDILFDFNKKLGGEKDKVLSRSLRKPHKKLANDKTKVQEAIDSKPPSNEYNKLIAEFLNDLQFEYIDVSKYEFDMPEYYIKVYDVQQIREKWEQKQNEL